jgi:serine/threonine protein kinase
MSRRRSRRKQGTGGGTPADPDATLVSQPATGRNDNTEAAAATVRALEPGTAIGGDYRVMEVIARDEIAISYKAEDINLGVAVLIKELAPAAFVARAADGDLDAREDAQSAGYAPARARFLREAQTLVRFRHPNIARAHRMFAENNTSYIVLDYEQGQPLDVWLSELGRAPSQLELDRFAPPLLSALASVHDAGYVHADICPRNVLMRRGGTPSLMNFASARQQGEPSDASVSDPMFTAPELREDQNGPLGPAADLYGVAALLHLAVTGKPPAPDGSTSERARGGYRAEFLAAIERGLASDADARPGSVADWADIIPPEDEAPSPAADTGSAPTLVRDQQTQVSPDTEGTGPTEQRGATALTQLATRVISALPEIKEETDIPQHDFERWLLPAGIIAGVLGALLFATGWSFAFAAVFQVAATGLLFLRGYMPLTRFLSHTTRQPAAILRRAGQATRSGAWMIAAILGLMTVNPMFADRFIVSNTQAPLTLLAAIIAVPALMMATAAYFGTPVRFSAGSVVFGVVNVIAFIFSALLLAGFAYTILSTPENLVIHPAVQVNRYLYVIATLATGALGTLIFLNRVAAKQRVKQAEVG